MQFFAIEIWFWKFDRNYATNTIFGSFYDPALSGDKKIRNDIWTIGNERMFDKKG